MDESGELLTNYKSRINKTFDYIETHLEKSMTLGELAAIANFSKFHFTRIFHAMVGETPFQFITRLRLEKAASLIVTNKKESISQIAYACGFSDTSIFSRNFKSYFKVSPSQFRKEQTNYSNLSQVNRNKNQVEQSSDSYFCSQSQTLKWRTEMNLNESVEVKQLPKMTVAYIRHTGPYQGDEKLFERLWNQLFTWAGPRGLIGGKDFNSLIIYHDDPNVTIEDKLRLSVCITVPETTKVDGEVGKMDLEAANYVIARFKVGPEDFAKAWQWVYGHWFPTSGYQPDDKPCFEMYPEEPKDGKFTVDICVPVKPL